MAGGKPAQKARPGDIEGTEERRLVEAAQGDPARFSRLYELSFEVVYAYVSRRVRDRFETEDLTAEVFRRALANLPRFKWTGAPFATWLFRIASNLIADRAKERMRESTSNNIEADANSRNTKFTKQTQQIEVESCERRAQLFRLVEDLAEDQRRVVVMRFAEEKSIREIANDMGRSEGAIKQLQLRALQNLRAALSK